MLNLEKKSSTTATTSTINNNGVSAVPEIRIDIDIDVDINTLDCRHITEPPALSPAMSDTTIIMPLVDSPVEESNYSTTNDAGDSSSSFEFINILREANLSNFLSFYYLTSNDSLAIDITSTSPSSYLPNEYETIAHLKLFKALAVLKKKVLANSRTGINPTLFWKGFITNAVRRFIVFVSALRKFMERYNTTSSANPQDNLKINKDPAFLSVMSQIVPPLDVLLVWHSFLANPSSFYDVFVRCNMLQFANFPFPLHKVCQYIDNYDFEFRVPFEYKHNYLEVIKCFAPHDPLVLRYEIIEFSPSDNHVTVCCPNCKNTLSDPIPLSNGTKGFGDHGLRSKNIRLVQDSSCYCSWIFLITHSELRKLQLYSDVKRLGILQGTFKIPPSEVIVKDPIKSAKKFRAMFDRIWDDNRFKSLETIISLLHQECTKEGLPHGKLLRNYTRFNLISMTVPEGVEIGDDLVEYVMRQERFNSKMNNLNWLHSPNINHILAESCSRYAKFFTMLANPNLNNNNGSCLRPTLDIELMWKTHNLSGFGYFKDCLTSAGHYIIDNDASTQGVGVGVGALLNNDINATAEVYKSIYKEEYLICYCQICTIERAISLVNPEHQPQTHNPPLTTPNLNLNVPALHQTSQSEYNSPFLKPPHHAPPPPPPITHSNSFDENLLFSRNSEYSWNLDVEQEDADDDQYSSTSAPAGILTNNSLLDEPELAGLGLAGSVPEENQYLDYFSYPGTSNGVRVTSSPSPGSVSPGHDEFIGIFQ
ncbi:hypothetical protein Cantr_09125 [Candida viswanathii]|uniref:Uncharacterized protein n=1 Tax=Candida viswanathii TaxID=5486 RepID=A0A367YAN0_9ASCO|nr:hypothetical protein Cantr_09125 [Candida viswanathii]